MALGLLLVGERICDIAEMRLGGGAGGGRVPLQNGVVDRAVLLKQVLAATPSITPAFDR